MLIIGAKGHAKEILDLLYKNNDMANLCFYDDVSDDVEDKLYKKFLILKSIDEAKKYFDEIDNRFHLGIGNPSSRKKLYQKFISIGGKFTTVVSNKAEVGNFDVKIEEGCTIASQASINNSVLIKLGTLVNRGVAIAHECTIGEFVELSPNVIVSGNCQIGDYSFLGTGAIVIPKIEIGKNVIVAAGSVVTKDVPDNCMIAGVPAIIKKQLPEIEL